MCVLLAAKNLVERHSWAVFTVSRLAVFLQSSIPYAYSLPSLFLAYLTSTRPPPLPTTTPWRPSWVAPDVQDQGQEPRRRT